MKAKISFNKQAVQEFLLLNVEKIVFGVVMLLFVLLVYGAMGRESYEKTPANLQSAAENARRNWENTPPGKDENGEDIPPADDPGARIDEISSNKIDPTLYKLAAPPLPPLFLDIQVDLPPVLALAGLRGMPGIGAVRMSTAEADGGTEEPAGPGLSASSVAGLRWVVLTGKVPNAEWSSRWIAHYRDSELPAPLPESHYFYYYVERAEVTDPAVDPDDLNWIRLNLGEALGMYKTFDGEQEEVVPAQFLLSSVDQIKLVMPLPPLVDTNRAANSRIDLLNPTSPWEGDGSIASPPEIPATDNSDESEDPAWEPGGPEDRPGEIVNPFNRAQPDPDDPGTEGGGEPVPEVDSGYLLFRYFDFSVLPGKQYRYRVQLKMRNPNFGQDPRHLTDPADAELRFLPKEREEKWDLTEIVYVPRDTRLLAGSVKASPPTQRFVKEPSAKMLLVTFAMQTGRYAHREIDVTRGLIANKLASSSPRTSPRGQPEETEGFGPLESETAVPVAAEVDFITDALILDLRGGESLTLPSKDKVVTPGEILILSVDGRLIVHREMDDMQEYLDKTTAPEEAGGEESPFFDPEGDGEFDRAFRH